MAVLDEIAEKAGVSRRTAAAVLSGSHKPKRPAAQKRARRIRRVAERLLSIQETIILEKVFLQTFARRDKLTPVYGKGEAAGLMRDVHVPEIRRQSLAFLRRLHETEPGRLDAATEALDEEETPRNHQVHTLIQRYVCQSDRSTDRKPGVI
jgi:transcriptional regulator with XRE-family HTH domain